MCMIDDADGRCAVYRRTTQRSSKPRRCQECGRPIAVGERYCYAFMVYDSMSATFATCEHCGVAQDWLSRNCRGFLHAGVWEDIREHIDEYRRHYPVVAHGLARLFVAQRRRWSRFDGAGLMGVPVVPPVVEAH